jgi:hypothetical protein
MGKSKKMLGGCEGEKEGGGGDDKNISKKMRVKYQKMLEIYDNEILQYGHIFCFFFVF